MRKMKDSGIEWIGEIPEEWGICKLKNVALIYSGEFISKEEYIDDGEYSIIGSNGEIGKTNKSNNKSEVIVTGRVGTIGTVQLVKKSWITDNALVVDVNSQNLRYIFYIIPNFDFSLISTGTAQPLITGTTLKEQKIPLPNQDTQSRIADFLDDKCGKIDRYIETQRAIIEKLKAYKQAVITETVTKGLDPTAPMKDSSVEWIGEIPQGWEVLKLRSHTTMLTPMRDRPENLDGEIPWVRIEDYDGKYISASKEGLGVSLETVKAMNLKIYPVGSVLCTSSCDLGKCAIVSKELVSNQRFINIIPDNDTNSDFLYYLMLSNAERLNHLSTGTIQANLSRVSFEHLMVQFPPKDEQQQIAAHLDKRIAKLDSIISKKQSLIDKLTEYKKSLIYEVVTGKKEV